MASAGSASALRESSPFKDVMPSMEKLVDFSSPPKSADFYKKPSFFQSFTRSKPNFRIPRSSSMRTPSPPRGLVEQKSPPPQFKPLSSPSTSFSALSKIRRSVRERGKMSEKLCSPGWSTSASSPKRFIVDERERELLGLRDDLQAARDEAAASKEVIALLRKQIETLQRERDTL